MDLGWHDVLVAARGLRLGSDTGARGGASNSYVACVAYVRSGSCTSECRSTACDERGERTPRGRA